MQGQGFIMLMRFPNKPLETEPFNPGTHRLRVGLKPIQRKGVVSDDVDASIVSATNNSDGGVRWDGDSVFMIAEGTRNEIDIQATKKIVSREFFGIQ